MKKADGETETEPTSFCFRMSDCPTQRGNKKGLMVDCGATTHMINDATKFKMVDKSFRPEDHMIELADGSQVSGMAKMRGDAEVYLLDSEGQQVKTRVRFKDGNDWLVHKDGTMFKMDVYGKLYYLSTVEDKNVDEVYGCRDIQTWHRILGHCNFDDVAKLEKVVEGMSIKGKHDKSNQDCEICTQGKVYTK